MGWKSVLCGPSGLRGAERGARIREGGSLTQVEEEGVGGRYRLDAKKVFP